MVITPSSTVNLYKDIPIENGLTLAFKSKSNQTAYFNRKLVRREVNCTMIKKTGRLQLEVPGNIVTQCNYISFVNPDFDNRVFYALITDYEYINNECTSITYVIDFLQTYMFDLNFKTGTSKARESLSENEYMKASNNPYDPTIYPLSTPEDLAFGTSIEPPVYEYFISTDGIQSPQSGLDAYKRNCKYDGFYIGDISTVSDATISDYASGFEMSLVMLIAPIDFSEISTEVKEDWDRLMGLIEYSGGDYIGIVENTGIVRPVIGVCTLKTNNLRAYEIIRIPLATTIPDSESTAPNNRDSRILFQRVIDSLTYLNATSQIISIYSMPTKYFDAAFKPVNKSISLDVFDGSSVAGIIKYMSTISGYSFLKGKMITDSIYEFKSHKLYRHPYTYLRVESPDLTSKEYRFEDFYDFAKLPYVNTDAINTECTFVDYAYLDGTPRYFIAPYKYGNRADGRALDTIGTPAVDGATKLYGNFKGINHMERMEYSDFPMVPFTTDAYLTFISNQVMNVTRANTADFQDQLSLQRVNAVSSAANTMTNLLGSVISSASGIGTAKVADRKSGRSGLSTFGREHELRTRAGGLYSDVSSTGSGVFSGISDFANIAVSTQSSEAQIEEADKYFSGIGGPAIDYGRYNDTKPAFANNIYHAGSDGSTNLLSGIGNYYFKFTYVHPKDDILEKYDNYFLYYGYNQAGRTGVPYIANYFKDLDSTENDMPNWVSTEDGESYYIQTMNCEVTGAPLPVITFIKSLFNNGVRFIKGDDL